MIGKRLYRAANGSPAASLKKKSHRILLACGLRAGSSNPTVRKTSPKGCAGVIDTNVHVCACREGHTLYRVHLTEEERQELKRRTRAPGIKPRTRDRLEMIRLLDAGWHIPQIAHHLRVTPRRVRIWVRLFLDEGFEALRDQPHPGRPGRLTPELLARVREELEKGERTWTTGQLAAWLEETQGVSFSRDHLGFLLRRARLSCRRTERDLGHKRDPEEVAVRMADLETLEKGAMPGVWTSCT
jgi:transposase